MEVPLAVAAKMDPPRSRSDEKKEEKTKTQHIVFKIDQEPNVDPPLHGARSGTRNATLFKSY